MSTLEMTSPLTTMLTMRQQQCRHHVFVIQWLWRDDINKHQRCFNIITTTASSSSCHCNETTTMSTTLQRRWITTRDVATGLISTHATQKTDAIVTKSCGRGHSLFRRLFTGPISAQWLRHATVIKPLHLPVQTGVPCPAACAVPSPCPGVCPSLFYYDRCGLSSKDLS